MITAVSHNSYNAVQNNSNNTAGQSTQVGYQYTGMTEDDRRVRQILQEHYDKMYKENMSHSNPMAYVESKYCDVTSPNFRRDMSADQRNIAYRNEKRMIETGGQHTAGFGRYDYALRNYKDLYVGSSSDIGYKVNTDKEKQYGRSVINEQISKLLSEHGISMEPGEDLKFTIDPYTYRLGVSGNADQNKMSLIEKLLNEGNNAKNLWSHAWTCMHDSRNEIVNSQANMTKANQFSLWHEIHNVTGYDAREAKYKNGTFLMPDGIDLLAVFKEKETHPEGYDLFSKRLLEYANGGWNSNNDLVLTIGFNSNGLYDIGQEKGYGAAQSSWIKDMGTSIFDAKV